MLPFTSDVRRRNVNEFTSLVLRGVLNLNAKIELKINTPARERSFLTHARCSFEPALNPRPASWQESRLRLKRP